MKNPSVFRTEKESGKRDDFPPAAAILACFGTKRAKDVAKQGVIRRNYAVFRHFATVYKKAQSVL